MATVSFEKVSPFIGVVKLNDPDNLNAMSEEMAEEFAGLISNLSNEMPRLRAIILSGEGKAFSAGGHLAMLEKKRIFSAEQNRVGMLKFYRSFLSLLDLEIPLIAAMNGAAVGAGLCLATACDIRIASEKAKLGFTFVKLGLYPGMGATYFLPRVIGSARASELMLTGRIIDAAEAYRIGLVSEVVKPEEVLKRARAIAEEVVSGGPEAIRMLLQGIRSKELSFQESLEREALCQSVSYGSEDFAEGLAAVREKREPQFGK